MLQKAFLLGGLLLACTAGEALEVICVPANGQDPTVPHSTWSGNSTVLKAIVRGVPSGDSFDYTWDFGDASAPASGTTTSAYAVQESHTYAGAEGDKFAARLEVTYGGDTVSDFYYVEIRDGTSLAVQTSAAIDRALWYMHRQMTRTTASGVDVGYWSSANTVATTAGCVEAFELQGHRPDGSFGEDPYVETVQRGLNYLLNSLVPVAVGVEDGNDPDMTGNGVGLALFPGPTSPEMYMTGIVLLALAESRSPLRVAPLGDGTYVKGQIYWDIVQEIVDFVAFAQNDPSDGSSNGGWRYTRNFGTSDNDVTRWVVMGLESAERNFGIFVLPFVRDGVNAWTNSVQNPMGASGYSSSGDSTYGFIARTSGLLIEHYFLGNDAAHLNVQAAMDYMEFSGDWGVPASPNAATVGNYCAMRGVRQGMSLYGLRYMLGGFPWYEDGALGLGPALVNTQNPDGSWTACAPWTSGYEPLGTALAVATLVETVIGLWPGAVNFVMMDGGSDPASTDIMVVDLNDGVKPFYLSWSAMESAPWLSVVNSSGGDGDTFTLSVTQGALAPGRYVTQVEVKDSDASNSSVYADVQFEIFTDPLIVPSSTSVTFTALEGGTNPGDETIVIDNSAYPTDPLSWTADDTSAAAWLTLSDASGTDGDKMTLSAATGSLTPGDHTANVRVYDALAVNAPLDISVLFEIQSRPEIALSDGTITFTATEGDSDPSPQTVTVTDANTGLNPHPLAWTAADITGATWLTLAGTSGGDSDTVGLRASLAGLGPGDHTATVRVSDPDASNTPQDIAVTLRIRSRPEITLSRSSVSSTVTEGDPDPSPSSVTVTDANTDSNPIALAWAASEDPEAAWLTLAGASGGDGDSVSLSAALAGLNPGQHSTVVHVADANASNSPQDIDVTLTIRSKPEIALSQNSVALTVTEGDPDPSDVVITVTDANTDASPIALAWTAVEVLDKTWLELTGTSGGDGGSTTISASLAGLGPGDYSATVRVTDANASNSPQDVAVSLTIRSKPEIVLSRDTVTFTAVEGSTPSPEAVTVTDVNTDANPIALAWTAVENPDRTWLTLTNDFGGHNESLSMSVDTASLAAGNYSATVLVQDSNASNSPQSITVSLVIQSQPAIELSAATVTFAAVEGGSDPSPESVTVTDTNTDVNPIALAWAASESPDEDWLALADASGASGDVVTLAASTASLAAGTYNATVVVTDPNASNSPQTIAVTLTVHSLPAISLDPASVTFRATVTGGDPDPVAVTVTNGSGAVNPLAMAWTATEEPECAWLSLTDTSGTDGEAVTLTASTDGLTSGSYSASVEVADGNATNSPQTIDIGLLIGASAPVIGLSRESVSFLAVQGGADPAQVVITVTDLNTEADPIPMLWTASEVVDEAWLDISNISGGDGEAFTVGVYTAALTPGTYTATIEVDDPAASNTPRTLEVRFTVAEHGEDMSFIGSGGCLPVPLQTGVGAGGAGLPAAGCLPGILAMLTLLTGLPGVRSRRGRR